MVKYLRLFTGADGETHFDEHEMEEHPLQGRSSRGQVWPAGEAIFLSAVDSAPEMDQWHPAPARQFIIMLSGTTEIEASDGRVRRFGPGEILLVEDIAGKGHKTRYRGPRSAVHIPIG